MPAGLDFVPLTWERFDLVLRQRDYFLPGPQALFGFLRTPAFRERAAELGGYDVGRDRPASATSIEAGNRRLRPLEKCRARGHEMAHRRGGRVAEGARLESVYTGNRIVGSNPTLSANFLTNSILSRMTRLLWRPVPLQKWGQAADGFAEGISARIPWPAWVARNGSPVPPRSPCSAADRPWRHPRCLRRSPTSPIACRA